MQYTKQLILSITVICSFTLGNTNISGTVTNKHNNQSLQGCNVTLEGSNIGTTTDKNGYFYIHNLDPGIYNIHVKYVGYITAKKTINIIKNQSLNIDFSVSPTVIKGNEVVVTATKTKHRLAEIPGRVNVITKAELRSLPTKSLDDILKYLPGLDVHRTSGIYEIRPVVSLRGMSGDEPGRTLVLLNGVPINKSDTGTANWNRINTTDIEQIEVLKGAGSSLYGNNAMGGVINIITATPNNKFNGSTHTSFGTYNTVSGNQHFSGKINKLRYNMDLFTRKSDGYYDLPDSLQNDNSVPLFLNENSLSTSLGYDITDHTTLEVTYDYYDDERGEGVKIEKDNGKHRNFDTNVLHAKIHGEYENSAYEINAFYQYEKYLRVDEGFKRENYYNFNVISDRIDKGLLLHYSHTLLNNHLVTLGSEVKWGSVDGGDYYTTSPDTILNRGEMLFNTIYLQDEFSLLSNQLRLVAGIRYDNVKFSKGYFHANLESNAFYSYNGDIPENQWNAVSPRLAVKYQPHNKLSGYLSYSQGFRASILDDLCRTGWMRLGPKEANPDLGPETLNSYELGFDYSPATYLKISPSVYYSKGSDFLYFVATGDSLWGRKPIYRRENVTEVSINGAEVDFNFKPSYRFSFQGSYTYNSSTILRFPKHRELEGKILVYSPLHKINATMQWRNKYLNINFGINYKDSQFTNDDNSEELDAYYTLDAQISRMLFKKVKVVIDFQNITDKRKTEHFERLSPGRVINVILSYDW